jgi:hypothetical protein
MIRKSFKKCGISTELDGTEDHLFNHASDDETVESDFEGFDPDDVNISEQVQENVAAELSESDQNSDSDDQVSDCDSPGH